MAMQSARQSQCLALREWLGKLDVDDRERLAPGEVWSALLTICETLRIGTHELVAPMLSAYREAEAWCQENLLSMAGHQRPGHQLIDLRERINVSLLLLEGSS